MTKSMQLTYGTRFFWGVQVLTSSGSFRAWDMKVWTSSWRAMMTNLPMPSFLIFDRLVCWSWHPIFESTAIWTQKMAWNQTKNLPLLRFSVAPQVCQRMETAAAAPTTTTTSTSTSTTSTFHTPIPFHLPEISSALPARCLFTLCAGPGKEVRVFDGRTEGKIVEARHVWNLVTWDLANFFDDLMHRHGCFFNCVTLLNLIFSESFASKKNTSGTRSQRLWLGSCLRTIWKCWANLCRDEQGRGWSSTWVGKRTMPQQINKTTWNSEAKLDEFNTEKSRYPRWGSFSWWLLLVWSKQDEVWTITILAIQSEWSLRTSSQQGWFL